VKPITTLSILFTVGIMAAPAWCAENSLAQGPYPSFYEDSILKQTVLLGIDYTIREKYDTADSIFVDLAQRFPKSPVGPLFRAAVLQTKMLDHEDGRAVNQLKILIEDAIDKSQRWRERAPENPEPIFYQAAAYGYWAVYESHWGGWFAALKRGLKASNRFKEVIELDPTFFDAYLGLGNYLYWKSVKTSFINWLPFIPDDRVKGIRYIQRAADEGTFGALTAKTSLVWVKLDFGFPVEALEIAKSLREENPEAKVFMWGVAFSSYFSYRWKEAIEMLDSLEARILAEGPGNYYNLIDCAYYKADAAFRGGDFTRCREECRRAFAYPLPTATRKRAKDKLAELNERYHTLSDQVVGGK